jgi:lysophospholipase L1-like esterase
MRILSSPVFYEGEKISFAEAVERGQPRVLILSFGLNGLPRWSRDPEAFLRNYRALIDGIFARSPNTKIILQSVYPVGENDCFSAPVPKLNAQIQALNAHIASLSQEYENVVYINTAALLSDASGALLSGYDIGDGIHLTNEAYRIILSHLCQTMGGAE